MEKIKYIFFVLVAGILLTSCSASKTNYRYSSSSPGGKNGYAYYGKLELHGDFENDKTPTTHTDTQKIVYTARIDMKVNTPDSVVVQIAQLAKDSKGYVERMSSNMLVIKVPAGGMTSIVAEIEKMGKVTYKNVSADDITDSYYDAAIRLENLDKARQRYLELLAKAQTVDEILKVEKELERVNTDMEVLKGRLARMNNQVQYSTITIYLDKKVKPGILGYPFVWTYKAIKWLFVRK